MRRSQRQARRAIAPGFSGPGCGRLSAIPARSRSALRAHSAEDSVLHSPLPWWAEQQLPRPCAAANGRGRWAASPARTPGTPGPCAKRVRGGGRRSLPAPCPAAPSRARLRKRRCLQAVRGRPRCAAQPEPCRRLADHTAGLPCPGPAAQAPWAPWSIGWTAQAAMWMRWTL